MTRTPVISAFLLAAAVATSVDAQSGVEQAPVDTTSINLLGITAGFLAIPGLEAGFGLVGFHVTSINPGRLGSEFSLYLAPETFIAKHPIVVTDISFLQSSLSENGWITLTVGGSAMFWLSSGGGGMLPGVHGGLGAIFRTGERSGIRIEIEPRFMLGIPYRLPILSTSIGLTSFPPRK
jgi:hypothetical protein